MPSAEPSPPNALVARYDADAELYVDHWGPVLEVSARALLDRVQRELRDVPRTILDVGTGTGVLALDAVRRWPEASVIGSDASSGMLRMARQRHERDGHQHRERLHWLHAPADGLNVASASVDLVVSSFVYQLVPDRAAAFAEARRVLRPGGHLAFVTWLDRGPDFEPAVEFDEAVYDVGIEEPEREREAPLAGDFRSPRGAAREVRAARFERVRARGETLEYRWTPESYLRFKQEYEEDDLFGWLDADQAARLVARARERFAELPPEAFLWRADIVSLIARRPG
jgi:ubiquinone/menaquinone biosynthesis C-methylase UbiE